MKVENDNSPMDIDTVLLNNTYLSKVKITDYKDELSINHIDQNEKLDVNFKQIDNYQKDNEQLYIKDLNKILDEEKG